MMLGSGKLAHLLLFTRQFEVAVNSGVPIAQALANIRVGDSRLTQAIEEIQASLGAGEYLSGALRKHPDLFEPLYLNLVRLGEETGRLASILTLLADRQEVELAQRGRLTSALVYPALVLAVTLGAGLAISLTVLPPFLKVLVEMEVSLPLLTRLLVGGIGLAGQPLTWVVVAALAFGWGTFLHQWLSSRPGRLHLEKVLREMPLLGPLLRDVSLSRWCAGLYVGLRAGLTTTASIGHAAASCDSPVLEDDGKVLVAMVTEGASVSEYLRTKTELYPRTVVGLVAIGEQAGKLPEMFFVLMNYFQEESEHRTKMLLGFVEPLLLGTVSVVAGTTMLALLLPLYSLLADL